MKTSFSSVVTSLPPKRNVAKCFVDVDWFPTLKKGEGVATFHESPERAEFTPRKRVGNRYVSQQLFMIVASQLYSNLFKLTS